MLTGCVTEMLRSLELPSLKDRRKAKRLIFMYNIQKGLVPAIPTNAYLKPIGSKRRIKAKTFSDFDSRNIVKRHQLHCIKGKVLPFTNIKNRHLRYIHVHSYFPITINEWNYLSDSVVNAQSTETFKDRHRPNRTNWLGTYDQNLEKGGGNLR